MKPKSPNGSGSLPDGEQFGDGTVSTQAGSDTGNAVMMPNDGSSGTGSGERGMPGIGERPPEGQMPGGGMEAGRRSREFDMPGGGMGSGGGGGVRGGGEGGGGGGDNLEGTNLPQVRKCGTMDVHRRLLSTSPEYARVRDEIENETLRLEGAGVLAERTGITRIPVVVHVVWNTAAQNISDAQIASQIDVLNRHFRRTNPDVSTTPAPFLPLAADSRIEFYLATSDRFGAPTSGIERRQTSVAKFDPNDAVKSTATGGLNAWPASQYLNM